MAVIAVEIDGILGECTIEGYADKLDALALEESIEVAVPQTAGNVGVGGGVGRARHSEVELTRYKDRASPKLAQACSAAENLGTVKIHLFRALETGAAVYMSYTLAETFVSRIEHDTLEEGGVAFQPHLVTSTRGGALPPSVTGVASLVTPLVAAQTGAVRVAPRPAYGQARGPATNREVERLWLNASDVTWTYTPYIQGVKSGVVEKGFSVRKSRPL